MGNSLSSTSSPPSAQRRRALRHARSAPLGLKRSFASDHTDSTADSDDHNAVVVLSEKLAAAHHTPRPINVALAHHIARVPPPPRPPPHEHEHEREHELDAPPPPPPLALPPPTAGLLPPAHGPAPAPADAAYARFLHAHPRYAGTWPLDALRAAEYTRVRPADAYVDYMGGALYPASLVAVHADFLRAAVLGNTHSESASSKLSAALADAARAAVLAFFNAPEGSAVVFTANASAALKLVGEAFPFTPGGALVLPEDAHNSVHGIREFARAKGAAVAYMPAGRRGGVRVREAKALLHEHRPAPGTAALFAYTGLSNLTNTKPPLALLAHAATLGYTTLLDAAALAPTAPLDLSATRVDAVALSFYKMFGFPTGVGALVLAPGVGARLVGGRPWFAGGGVDVVQVPGRVVTRAARVEEAFEDGTINYALLPAVTTGLRLLGAYVALLPARVGALAAGLAGELEGVRWPGGAPAVRVLSRVPGRVEQDEEEQGEQGMWASGAGGTVSCIFLDPRGTPLALSLVCAHAAEHGIALRTGCMCNPGGAAGLLGLAPLMAALRDGDTLADLEARAAREWGARWEGAGEGATGAGEAAGAGRWELGVVRMSFGLGSAWADVWRVAQWVRGGVAEGWGVVPAPARASGIEVQARSRPRRGAVGEAF
ncbi:PLP-dependent transferase [Auriscalpium vulgare]|uniref:PLP-dependent transferase n=1 Tax=Auriscalpium vulgare TaxID=40419 RepID=A0ACB8RX66_9AGAM|nr:PLP-dependent transferase [Auriscalpium vulgare]